MKLTPTQFLVIGFLLVTYGMVIPFLMTLRILTPTFFLAFSSYIASFLGLIFGVIGIATYFRENRRDR